MSESFLLSLLVMAGVTYLVRMLPMVFLKKPITNRFLLAFLKYIPVSVLAAMTVPASFFSTGSPVSAIAGFAVGTILALFDRKLLTVALGASAAVFVASLLLTLV